MKDQKGVGFLMSNTCEPMLCSLSREPAVSGCDEHMCIHTPLQEEHTIDLISMGDTAPQSAALTVVMRHIAAQSVQSSTKGEKESGKDGGG